MCSLRIAVEHCWTGGGAHGVLVNGGLYRGVRESAEDGAAKGHVQPGWTSPGEFPTPIFDIVLKRLTVRGSIVGTRHDLEEDILRSGGKVSAEISKEPLEN
jgi:propanol-preferring alcohol dehydrogenase